MIFIIKNSIKLIPYKKKNYKITYWGTKEILTLNKINVESYIYKQKSRKGRNIEMFERMFNSEQQKILKYFMTGPKTNEQFADFFKISKNKAKKIIYELKNKEQLFLQEKRKKNVMANKSTY